LSLHTVACNVDCMRHILGFVPEMKQECGSYWVWTRLGVERSLDSKQHISDRDARLSNRIMKSLGTWLFDAHCHGITTTSPFFVILSQVCDVSFCLCESLTSHWKQGRNDANGRSRQRLEVISLLCYKKTPLFFYDETLTTEWCTTITKTLYEHFSFRRPPGLQEWGD